MNRAFNLDFKADTVVKIESAFLFATILLNICGRILSLLSHYQYR